MKEIDFELLKSRFRHSVKGTVRFAEVDSFRVVHNLQYLFWAEWARAEYVWDCGIMKRGTQFEKAFPILVVHAEIDYFNPAKFAEEYIVYTRISQLGKSSVAFENLVTRNDGLPFVTVKNISVLSDLKTGKSTPLPAEIREKIIAFEGDILLIKP